MFGTYMQMTLVSALGFKGWKDKQLNVSIVTMFTCQFMFLFLISERKRSDPKR